MLTDDELEGMVRDVGGVEFESMDGSLATYAVDEVEDEVMTETGFVGVVGGRRTLVVVTGLVTEEAVGDGSSVRIRPIPEDPADPAEWETLIVQDHRREPDGRTRRLYVRSAGGGL